MLMFPWAPCVPRLSLVFIASQFTCGSWISLVSSIETIFATDGMKKDAAFMVEVLPDAVPPAIIRLFLFSTASQMCAMSSELYVLLRTSSAGVIGSALNLRIVKLLPFAETISE